MDPRHPEKALPRIKELIEQYERVEKDIASATVPNKIGEFEREGFMVIQEMSFITPRLHERLALITRQRRRDLSRGKVYEQMKEYAATAERADESKLTPEEEEDFARLLVILDNAKKQFDGKDARNKATGEVYTNLYFLTIEPFSTDNQRYGIIVSMSNDKEILSFGNETVIDFLNDYEPVENSEPAEEKEAISETEATTTAEEGSATGSKMEQVEPVKEEKPKQTAKKKTTKKANK